MRSRTAKLGELVEFISGFAFKSSSFNNEGIGMPLVRIRDVLPGSSTTSYSGPYDARFVVKDGDYLIGMDGEFNLARWRGGEALLNQRVCKIGEVASALDRHYLGRFLPIALRKIEDATPFVTVKHLSLKDLRAIEVPLPPIDEQRRIAAILDQADALRVKRGEALALLDDLTQSIFIDMFGRLGTGDQLWPRRPLAEICEAINDCPHSTPKWTDSGEVCLRTSNLTKGGWDWSDTRYVSPEDYVVRSSRGEVRAGDLILSREGTVGVAALVPEGLRVCMGQRLVHVRPATELIIGEFLLAYLLQALAPERISHIMVGSTARHLNVKDLRALPVPVPPLAVQQTFATGVTTARATQARMHSHALEADMLFASLQAQAFSGRL